MLAVDAMPVIWALIIICSLLHEMLTSALVAVWFIPSAMLALILTICGLDVWICAAVFFAASALMLLLSRTIFKRSLGLNETLIGCEGIVMRDITPKACGSVRVMDKEWQALTEGRKIITSGSIVKIKGITDSKLICTIK